MDSFLKLYGPSWYGLLIASAVFIDLSRWRSLQAVYLLCGKRSLLTFWANHAARWGWALLSGGLVVDWLPAHNRGLNVLIATWLFCGVVCILASAAFSIWRRGRSSEPSPVARGAFYDGVRAVWRKTAGMRRFPSVYLVSDGFMARSGCYSCPSPESVNIFTSRRFLDWLSRGEVNALVGFQCTRYREYAHAQLVGLAVPICSMIAAAVIFASNVVASRWEVFLALLAVQLLALTLLWPRLQAQTDRRAIEIAGDPDVYLSAMVKLYRLAGASPDRRYLSRIAHTAGIAPERLRTLLQEELRPAEDRYPTSGDYMAVGF